MISMILYLLLFGMGYYLLKFKSNHQVYLKFLLEFFKWKLIISLLRVTVIIIFGFTSPDVVLIGWVQLGMVILIFALEIIAYFNLYKFLKNYLNKNKKLLKAVGK